MDLDLPGTPGLEATRRIVAAAPSVAVLVLTMVDDDQSVMAALRVGPASRGTRLQVRDRTQAALRARGL